MKLELIGLFTGAVRSFAQLEAEQRRAGRDTAQWQDSVAGYLLQIAAAGQHPHLARGAGGSGRQWAAPNRRSRPSTAR